jgi:hypothetical protein
VYSTTIAAPSAMLKDGDMPNAAPNACPAAWNCDAM